MSLDADARTGGDCAVCHLGAQARRGVVEVPHIAPPRVVFSHAAHRATPCASCHANVGTDPEPAAGPVTIRHLPSMAQCFTCHAGMHAVAPTVTACVGCHVRDPSGRMQTRFPEARLEPSSSLLGMAHDADWVVRHRWVGADSGPECATCHTERDCADCHDGRVRPPSVHPNDWLTTHGTMARRDAPRCASCHTVQSFCLECHARIGVSPVSAATVRSPARFHPPNNVWIEGPTLHAREAERSMQSCASCHAESDCITCHGARGVGGAGLSPHPPGFAADCATLLHANARACVRCHGEAALPTLCR